MSEGTRGRVGEPKSRPAEEWVRPNVARSVTANDPPHASPAQRRLSWPARLSAAFLIALFLAQSAWFTCTSSFTWDETKNLGIGRYLLTNRPWTVDLSIKHAPLMYYLSAVGLAGLDIPAEIWTLEDGVERGARILRRHGEKVVYLARLPLLVLGAVLGSTIFAWSRRLYGRAGGLVSLALFALSPNLIAHQSLITQDFSLTTFFFLTGWCVYRLTEGPIRSLGNGRAKLPLSRAIQGNAARQEPRPPDGESEGIAGRWPWAVATGVAAGLAVLSKFTALFLVPVGALWAASFFLHAVTTAMPGQRATAAWRALFRLRLWLSISGPIAALVVVLGYQLQIKPLREGIKFQYGESRKDWPSFFLGEVSHTSRPDYFLVATLVKVPVPLLILTVLSLVLLRRLRRRPDRLTCCILWVPIVFFLVYLSLFNRLNIGFRYLLPTAPFLLVWLGGLATLDWPRAAKGLLLGGLLAWQAASVGRVAPHYLAYFNEIAGGPDNGYRWLGDSNLDWGQDLKGLKRYVDQHPGELFLIRYFGTMPMELYGLRNSDIAPEAAPRGVLMAVSVTHLQGIYPDRPDRYRALWDRRPVATIGHSIRVYRL